MRHVVAVSGGVDSVVLLDMLANGDFGTDKDDLIVAHFDHGIRPDSVDDAAFVGQLAQKYGLPFETTREELGQGASEELARDRRYAFLRRVAKKYDADIVTAHHGDDVVETIAINLVRGTGWRGLAVLDSPDIWRPLLMMKKSVIVAYAKDHRLQWHEDSTNQDTTYLRNDLRQRLAGLDEQSKDSLRLYRNRQVFLRQMMDTEIGKLSLVSPYSRYFFIMLPDAAAIEILRTVIIKETEKSPTAVQLRRALLAIKVSQNAKIIDVAMGVSLRFTKTHFTVDFIR